MPGLIEKFGAYIDRTAPAHPDRVRRILRAAYGANGVAQRTITKRDLPPCRRYVASFTNDHMLRALAHPERCALVSLFLPCELLHAFGAEPMCAEFYTSYLAGAAAEHSFIRRAEEEGIADTFCSYHKALLGAAWSGVLPKPACIANTSLICDANDLTFRALAEHYGVPQYYVDVPPEKDAESVAYVADQLRELGTFLADCTGRRSDEALLREHVARSGRTIETFRACTDAKRGVYLRNDMVSEMYEIMSTHILLGTEGAERYARALLRDLRSAPPTRGLRLLWVHTMPNWLRPLQELFRYSERWQIIAGDLNFDAPEEMDPERPYESMARRLVYSAMNGPASHRVERAAEMCRRLDIDGVVCFCHWGCKQTLGASARIKSGLEAAGYPTLLLSGDGCDRRNTPADQIMTRMQAFLEMLEAKR